MKSQHAYHFRNSPISPSTACLFVELTVHVAHNSARAAAPEQQQQQKHTLIKTVSFSFLLCHNKKKTIFEL